MGQSNFVIKMFCGIELIFPSYLTTSRTAVRNTDNHSTYSDGAKLARHHDRETEKHNSH